MRIAALVSLTLAAVLAATAAAWAAPLAGYGIDKFPEVANVPPQPAQNATLTRSGPLANPNFFPISVWMQSARNAARYKAIGINTYVAASPKTEDLDVLKGLGLYAICVLTPEALKSRSHPTIIAWMHGDEPDNAQDMKKVWKDDLAAIARQWPEAANKSLKDWGTYGPPISPRVTVADYKKMKEADPSRPVLLNIGCGVAFDEVKGRGYRARHPEDYPEYIKACDIVSFDIYPANSRDADVENKLERVPFGVDRLVKWSGAKKPVWDCIECTPMDGPDRNPTPSQVKTEVWMSIIHGSKGIIYFVHIFKPNFIEAGVLANKEMSEAVAAVNKQIVSLAAVINSPNVDAATVKSSEAEKAPIDIMVKQKNGDTYVFAVNMRNVDTKGAVQIKSAKSKATVEVLGEDRQIEANDGRFVDNFKGYAVHIYKVAK